MQELRLPLRATHTIWVSNPMSSCCSNKMDRCWVCRDCHGIRETGSNTLQNIEWLDGCTDRVQIEKQRLLRGGSWSHAQPWTEVVRSHDGFDDVGPQGPVQMMEDDESSHVRPQAGMHQEQPLMAALDCTMQDVQDEKPAR